MSSIFESIGFMFYKSSESGGEVFLFEVRGLKFEVVSVQLVYRLQEFTRARNSVFVFRLLLACRQAGF